MKHKCLRAWMKILTFTWLIRLWIPLEKKDGKLVLCNFVAHLKIQVQLTVGKYYDKCQFSRSILGWDIYPCATSYQLIHLQGRIQGHFESGIPDSTPKLHGAQTRNCAQTDAQIHWIAEAIHGEKTFSTIKIARTSKAVYLRHKICCYVPILASLS